MNLWWWMLIIVVISLSLGLQDYFPCSCKVLIIILLAECINWKASLSLDRPENWPSIQETDLITRMAMKGLQLPCSEQLPFILTLTKSCTLLRVWRPLFSNQWQLKYDVQSSLDPKLYHHKRPARRHSQKDSHISSHFFSRSYRRTKSLNTTASKPRCLRWWFNDETKKSRRFKKSCNLITTRLLLPW